MTLVGAAAGFVLLIILVLGFGIRVASSPGAGQPLELTSDVVSFVLGSGADTGDVSEGEQLLDAYERSVILAWGACLESEAMVSVGAAAAGDPHGRRQANRAAVREALMQGRR
jgi:hypothetical protein